MNKCSTVLIYIMCIQNAHFSRYLYRFTGISRENKKYTPVHFQTPAVTHNEAATFRTLTTAKCAIPSVASGALDYGKFKLHVVEDLGFGNQMILRSDVAILIYDSTCQDCDSKGCRFKVILLIFFIQTLNSATSFTIALSKFTTTEHILIHDCTIV